MSVTAGVRRSASCSLSSSDELTGLFLSAIASPQSRPPLHPMRSPYKRPDPAQVFLRIRHNISFTPKGAERRSGDCAWQAAELTSGGLQEAEVSRGHSRPDVGKASEALQAERWSNG